MTTSRRTNMWPLECFASCQQIYYHSDRKNTKVKQSAENGLLYLFDGDKRRYSLFLSCSRSVCSQRLLTLSSVLTVLSCTQTLLLLLPNTPSFSPLSASPSFFSLSYSLLCLLSPLPSLPVSMGASTQPFLFFYNSFCGIFLWMCAGKGGGGGGQSPCVCVQLSILICLVAVGGRLVLVTGCVCAIWRCSCLFLIAYLKVTNFLRTLQVFLRNEQEHKVTPVCVYVYGGWRMHPCVFIRDSLHRLEPPLWQAGERR